MVSMWLADWPVEHMKRQARLGFSPPVPDEHPFALVEMSERAMTITAANAAAAAESIVPGLGLADARARCPQLRALPAEPERDARALRDLARWCGRYSPSLDVDGADGLRLDVTGVAHLFGGEPGLLHDMAAHLERLGLTARLGLADTPGAAWALARFGAEARNVAAPGACREALSALPVDGLRLAPETVTLLKRLGFRCIGQLYDIPRASLKRRFAARQAAEAVLTRLDQALGLGAEPGVPLAPPPHYAARLAFAEPLISAEPFETALEKLAHDLCARLARDLQGARRVTFTAYRTDGTCAWTRIGLSSACRTPAHLVRLLGEKVGEIDVGFGIDLMILAADAVERLLPEQETFADGREPVPAGLLIDRLSNRLRAARVVRTEPRESHLPERAERHRPAMAGPAPWPADLPAKPPRPPFLLERPEPIAVLAEIPEGPPARFTWRRVTRRIVRAQGPARIAPEWWREIACAPRDGTAPTGRPRDYYRIEDDQGAHYWVFREGLYQARAEDGPPDWYLHGLFG